jgi:urease accessory protein
MPIIMTEARDILLLMTWLSPGFPTGGFAYSHGLEWAVEAGDVCDAESLRRWLADILYHGAGRNDVILLRCAHRAVVCGQSVEPVMEAAAALSPSAERYTETQAQGGAFAAAAAPWGGVAAAAYPVSVGMLAGRHGIDEDNAALALLHAFIANLISAAVRLVPLGQSAGLRVQAELAQDILQLIEETRGAGLDRIGGCAFRADLAAMRHETQYTRLFRT